MIKVAQFNQLLNEVDPKNNVAYVMAGTTLLRGTLRDQTKRGQVLRPDDIGDHVVCQSFQNYGQAIGYLEGMHQGVQALRAMGLYEHN
jgi:hypothetical protein